MTPRGKNPKNRRKGGEKWRRDIWVGEPGAYPSIGPYHSGDPGVVRWHIRSAKAAGISAFLLFINRWKEESGLTDRLLNLAHEEGFKIGFIEHHGSLGIRSMREIDPESHRRCFPKRAACGSKCGDRTNYRDDETLAISSGLSPY